EYFLRRSQRLLENIVDAGKALDWFVQHQQRDDEAGELAGGHGSGFDLQARVSQQTDDGECAEELDQRRSDGLLRNVAKVAAAQAIGAIAEAVGFDFLGAE